MIIQKKDFTKTKKVWAGGEGEGGFFSYVKVFHSPKGIEAM